MIEVDAINFVPQSRPRIFVIGVQGDIASKVMAIPKRGFLQCNNSHPARTLKIIKALYSDPSFKIGHFDLPPLPVRRAALDSIIEPIPDSSHLWWNDERVTALMNQMSKNHLNAVTQAIALNKKSYFTVYRRVRKTGSMAEVRSDGVAGCLRTPRGGSSKQILLVCGNSKIQVRLMTPREYARLQGTSDSFQISTRQNDTTRSLFGLGDAVCVPVIRWIAANILNKIYTSVASEEQPSQLAVNEL